MINKVILVGNLGADPELRQSGAGMAIANLRIATSERRKVQGEWTDHTEWHRVTCFDKTAENVDRFLRKGSKVYIEGRIQTTEYEKDGQRKWSTEVVAHTVKFLDSKGDNDSAPASGGGGSYSKPAASGGDIPF